MDKEAPVISNFSANGTTIWPPHHKMVDIELNYAAKDNCGLADTVLTVRSNERNRDRNQEPDWRIINNTQIQLRAEKGKSPKDRVYTIETKVSDAAGNATVKSLEVRVAKDKSQQLSKSDGIAGDDTGLTVQVLNNPATDQFTIVTASDRTGRISLRVVDAAGRMIEQQSNLIANGQVHIGRTYRAGFYVAEFTQGEEKVVVKLIKQ